MRLLNLNRTYTLFLSLNTKTAEIIADYFAPYTKINRAFLPTEWNKAVKSNCEIRK